MSVSDFENGFRSTEDPAYKRKEGEVASFDPNQNNQLSQKDVVADAEKRKSTINDIRFTEASNKRNDHPTPNEILAQLGPEFASELSDVTVNTVTTKPASEVLASNQQINTTNTTDQA